MPASARGRSIALIILPSGVGGPEPGCALGPDQLLRAGLEEHLRALGARLAIIRRHPPDRPREPHATPGLATSRRLALRESSEWLATMVTEAIHRGQLPLVLGGDHSCAIGTWKGAAQAVGKRGAFGLIWLDAHLDAHTPLTTPSGMMHGMPLAVLLGHGERRLRSLADSATIDPRHLCVVGARSFETEEAALLQRLGVRVIEMSEIRDRGLPDVMAQAVRIASAAGGGWGVSIDVDVLDPKQAPGVATPAADGLETAALIAALAGMALENNFVAAELAEFNPLRDPHGLTCIAATRLLTSLFAPRQVA